MAAAPIGETKRTFERFLTKAAGFKETFGQDNQAGDFVDAIRNGLLHDGETRVGWIIWQGQSDGPIADSMGNGVMCIYRSAFHAALEEYVADYFKRLRGSDSVGLRNNFKSRIDQLCKDSLPTGDGFGWEDDLV